LDVQASEAVVGVLEAGLSTLVRASPGCVDGEVVRDELGTAIRLARQGAWRLLAEAGVAAPGAEELRSDLLEVIDAQSRCWLARARPGGLEASLEPLRRLADAALS